MIYSQSWEKTPLECEKPLTCLNAFFYFYMFCEMWIEFVFLSQNMIKPLQFLRETWGNAGNLKLCWFQVHSEFQRKPWCFVQQLIVKATQHTNWALSSSPRIQNWMEYKIEERVFDALHCRSNRMFVHNSLPKIASNKILG